MAITLPDDPGGYLTLNWLGDPIFDSYDDVVTVREAWSVEKVEGGLLAATGPGVDFTQEHLHGYDLAGNISIELDFLTGDANFDGNVGIGGDVDISGVVYIHGYAVDGESVTVEGDVEVFGNVIVHENVDVYGFITMHGGGTGGFGPAEAGSVEIYGDVNISEDVTIEGNVDIGGTVEIHGSTSLLIDGTVEIAGDVTITANLTVTGTTLLGGTLTLTADLDANGFKITAAEIEGSSLATTPGASGGITIIQDVINFAGSGALNSAGGRIQSTVGMSLLGDSQVGSAISGANLRVYGEMEAETVEVNGALSVDGDVGFYGATPVGFSAISGTVMTNQATIITVVNSIRSRLQSVNLG